MELSRPRGRSGLSLKWGDPGEGVPDEDGAPAWVGFGAAGEDAASCEALIRALQTADCLLAPVCCSAGLRLCVL